jgi:tetratricopeptide (TPR) repeat protein
MRMSSQTFGLVFLVPFWHCVSELMGGKRSLSLSGNIVDLTSACAHAQKEDNRLALARAYTHQAMIQIYLGDYDQALLAAKKAREFVPYVDYRLSFYQGLASLALARSATGWSRQALIALGKKTIKELQYWSSKGSPSFHNMVALLRAELASIQGRLRMALFLFDSSIKAARQERFIHIEGLAYERLALYHQHLGNEHTAGAYFRSAYDCYCKWGAGAVVNRVEQFLPDESAN